MNIEELGKYMLSLGFEKPYSNEHKYIIVSNIKDSLEEGCEFNITLYQPHMTVWITIHLSPIKGGLVGYIYQGRCKTIDDFNTICRLINLFPKSIQTPTQNDSHIQTRESHLPESGS